MAAADALRGLGGLHEDALICGCAIGAITFRHRDSENSAADLFLG
jgi:hypothetical protein